MGFTKKLFGRFGKKAHHTGRKACEDDSGRANGKEGMLIMTTNDNPNNNNINSRLPSMSGSGSSNNSNNKSRPSCMRTSSAKRLLSSFAITRRAPAHQGSLRNHNRRASIETAKISSIDFQSSRLYHNDSDVEDVSHSSYSDLHASISSSQQQSQMMMHSQRKFSSPPPVRIVEGNSSEEFSSGSIRARNSSISLSQVTAMPRSLDEHAQGDKDYLDPADDGNYRNNKNDMKRETDDGDETEHCSNVTSSHQAASSYTFEDTEAPLMQPLRDDEDDDDDDDDTHNHGPLTMSNHRRPQRASGSSDDFSNISDEDEEYDRFGVCTGGTGAAIHDIDYHLEFVPRDLRADYLLVYKFLQEEALLASIQDEQWRTQVRSARLRSNTRHHLGQINNNSNNR